MKFVHPQIDRVFDTSENRINSIIIENRSFFTELISDIYFQIEGMDGKCVLSKNDTPISFVKNAELLDRFVPFDINRKSILTKLAARLEAVAMEAQFYERSSRLISEIERYMSDISFEQSFSVEFPKLSVSSVIKSASVQLLDDYSSLPEKILDYMQIVAELDRKKMFFTVNLRSYITDTEAELFMKSAVSHGFELIMLESTAYSKCEYENRLIIDADLCEIA